MTTKHTVLGQHHLVQLIAAALYCAKDIANFTYAIVQDTATEDAIRVLWSRHQTFLAPLLLTSPDGCLQPQERMEAPLNLCAFVAPENIGSVKWDRFIRHAGYMKKIVLDFGCRSLTAVLPALVFVLKKLGSAENIFRNLKTLHLVNLVDVNEVLEFVSWLMHTSSESKSPMMELVLENPGRNKALTLLAHLPSLPRVSHIVVSRVRAPDGIVLLDKAKSLSNLTNLTLLFDIQPASDIYKTLPLLVNLEVLRLTFYPRPLSPHAEGPLPECDPRGTLHKMKRVFISSPFLVDLYRPNLLFYMPALQHVHLESRAQMADGATYLRLLGRLSESPLLEHITLTCRPEEALSRLYNFIPSDLYVHDHHIWPLGQCKALRTFIFSPLLSCDTLTDQVFVHIALSCRRLERFNVGGNSALLSKQPMATLASVKAFAVYDLSLEILNIPHTCVFESEEIIKEDPVHNKLRVLGGLLVGSVWIYSRIMKHMFPNLEFVTVLQPHPTDDEPLQKYLKLTDTPVYCFNPRRYTHV
ncbi:hypothetical protein CPB83DRAFT_900446 [Crepidotus variabilis]|uniref:Uncharacterized protein n=1 Tax=Crepidotus variabilis TaxID=179855 RepID=A0A9P6JHR3_9AGAR|nr:hypothetical protein CPB83DRAFT_900446 [Crepidotus variabilis]